MKFWSNRGCIMGDYVKINIKSVMVLLVSALLIALLLFSFLISLFKPVSVEADITPEEFDFKTVEVVEEIVTPVYVEKEVEKEVNPISMRKIGDFSLTAYCPCTICCDQWGGSPIGKTTAIGVGAYSGITFAVDPNKIPYGTTLYIEGVGVGKATDCGGAIKGNRIDVYFADHKEALNFGRGGGYTHAVYVIDE